MLIARKPYSQLNIHQKINFKANAVAYAKAFGNIHVSFIIKCDAILFDHLISYGKFCEMRNYKW